MRKLFYIILVLHLAPVTHQFTGHQLSGHNAHIPSFSQERIMFGVKLRPKAVKLLEEVERKYGKRVREEANSNLDAITYAHGDVDLDGTPVIKIKIGVVPTEAIIVHELFHLKYNFATIEFVPYENWMTVDNVAYIQFILAHLYSSIQHWIFFPQMRDMGLNPDDEVRGEFEKVLQGGKYPEIRGVLPLEARALFYFKAAMNIGDRKVLGRIKQWYIKNNWNDALDMGIKLEKIVTEGKPKTVNDAVKVFVECLKLIQRPSANFEFRQQTVKRIGAIDNPWVIIDVKQK